MPKKGKKIDWEIVHRDMSKEGIVRSFFSKREYTLAKDQHSATKDDNFMALSIAIRDRIIERWINTQQRYHKDNVKRVYYLSLEFLIGRLLGTNIINLGIWDEVKSAMESLGFDLEEIRDCESDAGLGNGGLGRLAACFLDSMATLGIPAHGYGIRYDYGIFHQRIVDGRQVERPDRWLYKGNPWEFLRLEYTTKISFYGRTNTVTDDKGNSRVEWIDTEDVLAVPYDTPVPGYKSDVVNTLRLWSARSSDDFDFKYFNDGDYEQAVYNKVSSESISKVLYPNDNIYQGKELRLKQEYFFTAAAISDIIRRFKNENSDFKKFPEKIAIQLNDTHPSLAIVELMRIFIDCEQIDWDTAWNITTKTFAYTNHTVMSEALEVWPVPLLENLFPRHMEIIYEINMRFINEVAKKYPHNAERINRMSIIEESEPKRVRMANLSIIGTHSVNGVSRLHTELIKKDIFKDFYDFYPSKFNNKTNGITQRRWLLKSNTELSKLITSAIGDKWITDADVLKKLLPFKDSIAFRRKWQNIKALNKAALARYIKDTTGVVVNLESMFDVQIKRMHEYKRQLLFGLFIIHKYLKIKDNPNNRNIIPRTFIIGGKAAPGYFMAKLIIKFINNIAQVVNNDKDIGDKLKVVFLPNYRVSLAERIFPASDLSEQISTAGTEASGTGCMKFMMNGALTIGTYDGANIEIAEEVGEDNIFIFGLKVDQIKELKSKGYDSKQYINNSKNLKRVIKFIQKGFISSTETGIFDPILDYLFNHDSYFVCADFEDYCSMQNKVSKIYHNRKLWVEKSIVNVANSGKFSSDRTIKDYASQIWDIPTSLPKD